jgi:DNA-binding response OmpR family regulator
VIDDERLIADSLAEILRQANFDAVALYSGQSAIDFALQECPDVVVSDVMMPRINGVQAVIAIRERCPSTRVLLFSGHAGTAGLLSEAESQGHRFEVLAKPVHPQELLRRLR